MKGHVDVTVVDVGGFSAAAGETLLDAALHNNIELPHDCRVGACGSCRVEVVAGADGCGGSVLACQHRLTSDISIFVEDVPHVEVFPAFVKALSFPSDDVVEVTLAPERPVPYLPGQYCRFQFAGLPERAYSPTVALEGPADRGSVRLHVRRVPGGRVSGALGGLVQPGHRCKITGPFGSAYLRPGKSERLVLVSSGTGFAPIWSIAHAALAEMPDREIILVVGARTRSELYMRAGLVRLMSFPNVQVVPVLSRDRSDIFPIGYPGDVMPRLQPDDLVYVCGAPRLVDEIVALAQASGSRSYADAFEPTSQESGGAAPLKFTEGLLPFMSAIKGAPGRMFTK